MGCVLSGEADTAVNPHAVDESHFTLLKVVGKGGFGKVNAVQKKDSGELLALKRMKKSMLVAKEIYVQTVWRERNVMSKFRSPFLCNLLYAFQDATDLMLIMPFMQGGDLRYYLETRGTMHEDMCRFYAAELIIGLEELHSLNIVYRDMKPNNVLFDEHGHVRISDFGLCVILKPDRKYKTRGKAGTSGYQAPEVLANEWYGTSADVWSFGVTIYELLEGQRPYHRNDDVEQGRGKALRYRRKESEACRDFVNALLSYDVDTRLAMGAGGWDDAKAHAWFADTDWDAMMERTVPPPHQPELNRANCSSDFELEEQFFNDGVDAKLTADQQSLFEGYEFNTTYTPPEPRTSTAALHDGGGGGGGDSNVRSKLRDDGAVDSSMVAMGVISSSSGDY
jgi:serine/threonine protein kinase